MAHAWITPKEDLATGDTVGLSTWFNGNATDLWHLRELWVRSMTLIGGSNAGAGDLVVQNLAGDDQVELTTTLGQAGPIGVALEILAHGGPAGLVQWGGIVPAVNVDGATDAGDWLRPSASGGIAASPCTRTDIGAFALALTSTAGVGTVAALIVPVAAGGGGTSATARPWDPYGLAVAPVAADFPTHDHWLGGDALTAYDDRVEFTTPGSASANESGLFEPWTNTGDHSATYVVMPGMTLQGNAQFSISLLEVSSDKRRILRAYNDTGVWKLQDAQQTTYATFGTGGSTLVYSGATQPIWLRVRNASGTRYLEYGWDGTIWQTLASETSTTYCTPTKVGLTVNANGTSQSSVIRILHRAVV